jgi:hypothetical protein
VFDLEGRLFGNDVVWEGMKLTIVCKLHGFSKGTLLFWTEPSSNSTEPHEHGMKITKEFNSVSRRDNGEYVCNAIDPNAGHHSKSVYLIIEATPTLSTNGVTVTARKEDVALQDDIATPILHPDNVTVLEGQTAVLPCMYTWTVTDDDEQFSTISWLREGRELQRYENTKISGRTNLTIYNVTRHHSGIYECRIKVGPIGRSAYRELIVYHPPKILEDPKDVRSAIGNLVTFHCRMTGNPEPTVTWQLFGTAIDTSEAQNKYRQSRDNAIHVLAVLAVQQEDSGLYSCYIRNDIGKPLLATASLKIGTAFTHLCYTTTWCC